MKNNIICIYPEDPTTDFLLPVYERLSRLSNFVGYRKNTILQDNRTQIIDALKNTAPSSIVVFMGHGASNRLYGSVDIDGTKQILLDDNDIELFDNFNTICISCRSAEFLKKCRGSFIGFGDIVSDFSEVLETRQFEDAYYLSWASEADIELFNNLFVEILIKTIEYTKCSDILLTYRILQLYINKTISHLLIEKTHNNFRHIADMFYNLLEDINFAYRI